MRMMRTCHSEEGVKDMEMEQRNVESAQSQLTDWSGLHHWRTLQERLGKVIDREGVRYAEMEG